MACDPQTLLSASTCYSCGIIPGTVQFQAIKLALLCRIKNGVTMACDVQTLLDEAKCFICQPPGTLQYLELALLCQIATGGGGGGGGSSQLMQGVVDPVAAPPDPTKPAYYTNLTSGVIFTWSVTGTAWI